jgi:acetyl-CoA carboxylase carboxyl transferase subunit alpha
VVDAIVKEPSGGAHTDYDAAARLLAEAIERELSEIEDEPGTALRRERRAKFRSMGVYA